MVALEVRLPGATAFWKGLGPARARYRRNYAAGASCQYRDD